MPTPQKKKSSAKGVAKLPVFTSTHPRPGTKPESLAPGADLLPPEKGFVLDARRISAIHERQKELALEIPEAAAKLHALQSEAEQLYKENHELRDAIAIAAGPEGWQEHAKSNASVAELRRR